MYIFIVVIIFKYPRLRVRQRTWAKEKSTYNNYHMYKNLYKRTYGRLIGNQDGEKDQR